MIGIIDYGLGNLGSIANMLKKSGSRDVFISSDCNVLAECSHLILPGVGAFDTGMRNIRSAGIEAMLNEHIDRGGKLLGICLGMQLLGNGSEEGLEKGLGFIDFHCLKFDSAILDLRVPHMGWNTVQVEDQGSPIVRDFLGNERYYFVHSYYAKCTDASNILMTTSYGLSFTSAVRRGNIYGVQFHPEKSHQFGMKLLHNFAFEV